MKYDICCLGSALVDITFQIDDEFVKANNERGIAKGGMTLIEKDDQINLIQELMDLGKSPDKACGGSATNSVVAASLFGSSCHMSCIVSDDDNGRFYLEDLASNGIDHTSELIDSEKYVGKNYKVTFRQEKPMKSGKYSNKVIPITYKIFKLRSKTIFSKYFC